MDIPPEEQYILHKMRILGEVQDDVITWAKRKVSVFIAILTVVATFGVGGFISLTVGGKIEEEMKAVDDRVLAAVKSTVQAELSAKQATQYAEAERERLTESAKKLRDIVSNIQSEAKRIGKNRGRC